MHFGIAFSGMPVYIIALVAIAIWRIILNYQVKHKKLMETDYETKSRYNFLALAIIAICMVFSAFFHINIFIL